MKNLLLAGLVPLLLVLWATSGGIKEKIAQKNYLFVGLYAILVAVIVATVGLLIWG